MGSATCPSPSPTRSTCEATRSIRRRAPPRRVPESLWTPAANALTAVVGLPTREELEAALAALRREGETSSFDGMKPQADAVPKESATFLDVRELTVSGARGKSDRYILTGVR